MKSHNLMFNRHLAVIISAVLVLARTASAQPTAPYVPDANTVVLDHFDGSAVGTIAAYRPVTSCGAPAPAVPPGFSFGPGPTNFSQALTLRPPTGEPGGSATYLRYAGELLSQPNGTLEFWAYLTSQEGGLGLVTQAPFFGACSGYTFHMVLEANGQLRASAFDFGFNVNSGTNRVALNTWTHLAVSWGGLGTLLYINGRVVGMDANRRGPSPGYGGNVLVSVGSHLAGASNRIDELRICNGQRVIGPVEPARLDIRHYAGITLEGSVAAQYRIEYVPAFGPTNAWQTLTNLTLPASPYLIIDYDSAQAPRRFYRAVTP